MRTGYEMADLKEPSKEYHSVQRMAMTTGYEMADLKEPSKWMEPSKGKDLKLLLPQFQVCVALPEVKSESFVPFEISLWRNLPITVYSITNWGIFCL